MKIIKSLFKEDSKIFRFEQVRTVPTNVFLLSIYTWPEFICPCRICTCSFVDLYNFNFGGGLRSFFVALPADVFVVWTASWQNQQNDCVPGEDSDQPGHPPSLIRIFAICMKNAWVLSYPLSAQRRLWSDSADAQADLRLRWVHRSLCWFCHEAVHLSLQLEMMGGYIVFICILCTNVVRSLSAYLGTDPSAAIGRGLMNTMIASAFCCLVTVALSFLLKRLLVILTSMNFLFKFNYSGFENLYLNQILVKTWWKLFHLARNSDDR